MRFTAALRQQHIGEMFKRHWKIARERTPNDYRSATALQQKGVPIIDALEFLKPKMITLPRLDIVGQEPLPEVFDETHPAWKQQECHVFNDSAVPGLGLEQAQVITKSLVVAHLPEKLQNVIDATEIPSASDTYMKNAVLSSHLFDAEQKKLPKMKHPEKPMWNYARSYGITADRKNRAFVARLLLECERLAGFGVSSQRKIVNNAYFVAPLLREEKLLQFQLHADILVASTRGISGAKDAKPQTTSEDLPDLYPLKFNASLEQKHFYDIQDVYPISKNVACSHPHTVFIQFSTEDVKNKYGLPVTETQYQGRALLKAFTVATAKARAEYGADVKDLPAPITVQIVQVNGSQFYFGAYQLNTLNLEGNTDTVNYWYHTPPLELYSACEYIEARPALREYNPDILKYVYGYYRNQ